MTAVPYARRSFSGGAIATTIPTGIGSSDTTFTVALATNWPSGSGGNFYVDVDRGLPTEEKILCSTTSSLVVTVASGGRGADGTSAVAHGPGCTVQVVHVGQDDDEANQVVSAVLGQASAAKGDIPVILSAAGPVTMTRLGVGANGSVLSAAAATPAYSAAGTAGQFLISGGSAVPVWITPWAASTGGAGTGRSSAAYASLTSPALATLTVNTAVKITISGNLQSAGTGGAAHLSYAVSGANTQAASSVHEIEFLAPSANYQGQMSFVDILTGQTPGSTTFALQYGGDGVNNATITNALIIVERLN